MNKFVIVNEAQHKALFTVLFLKDLLKMADYIDYDMCL